VGDRLLRRHGMEDIETHSGGDKVARSLVWLLVMLLFGWMFARFLETKTGAAVATLRREPAMSLGVGSLVWALIIPSIIALALVVALLCITIIGIPLALAALFGYFLFLAVVCVWGFAVGGAALGSSLSKTSQPTVAGAVPAPSPIGTPPTSLTRATLLGITLLIGACVLGHLIRSVSGLGPLRALGTLMIVLGVLGSILATTVGAGALLRSEFVSGTFHKLWNRRRGFGGPSAVPPAEPGVPVAMAPVAPTPPPTPPAPAPPSSFAPPPEGTPPPPPA
jgi:hypothetical protein